MQSAALISHGYSQITDPSWGSSAVTAVGCQIMSCRWPPNSKIIGGQYPTAGSSRDRPEFLSTGLVEADDQCPVRSANES